MTHTFYTFDIAYDCPISDFLEILDKYQLKIKSWTTIGPAGGNPKITIYGSIENIEKLKKSL